MYKKADINKVKSGDEVFYSSGRRQSHLFAKAKVVGEVDQKYQMTRLADIRPLFIGGPKAERLKPFCDVNFSNLKIRGPDPELKVVAPFYLVGQGFECFLTEIGLVCRQNGHRFGFDEGSVCVWTKSAGFAISQGKQSAFFNGQSGKILFVLNGAGIVEWYNEDQLEN